MLRAVFGATLVTGLAFAGPADTPPSFEVASIRVSKGMTSPREGHFREQIHVSPGAVTMRAVTLRTSLRWAYSVTEYQVTGPDWIASERYDIVAKAAAAAPEEQLRMMMQSLLAERFKVAFHRQTKELTAYILTVGKNGPKVHESKGDGEMSIDPDRARMSVSVQRAPMAQLVDLLTQVLRAPVIDRTDLKGRYDITIDVAKYMPDGHGDSQAIDPLSIIMRGLQEELGLKMESKKEPLELLVIDHAEKSPVEN